MVIVVQGVQYESFQIAHPVLNNNIKYRVGSDLFNLSHFDVIKLVIFFRVLLLFFAQIVRAV